MKEVEKDTMGYRLKGLAERASALGVSIYQARKTLKEYVERGLVKKWGNTYLLTEEGLEYFLN